MILIPLRSSAVQGYSYVAPSVVFSDNILTDELLGNTNDTRPNISQLLAAKFKVSSSTDQRGACLHNSRCRKS